MAMEPAVARHPFALRRPDQGHRDSPMGPIPATRRSDRLALLPRPPQRPVGGGGSVRGVRVRPVGPGAGRGVPGVRLEVATMIRPFRAIDRRIVLWAAILLCFPLALSLVLDYLESRGATDCWYLPNPRYALTFAPGRVGLTRVARGDPPLCTTTASVI